MESSGRGSKNSNATVRWTVAATSANTGGYNYFCRRQKCKRASSPVPHSAAINGQSMIKARCHSPAAQRSC